MDTLAQLRAGTLAGIRRLDLSCGLTHFPPEIFQLADTLEVLNLSGNALHSLPDDLGRLRHLRVLFCSDNRFTELPASIGQCRQLDILGFKANQIRHVPAEALPPSLRWLILTDNCIEQLPDTLGECAGLQKLMLAGNRLHHLPATLAACTQLELLRISANRLRALPDWLLALPRLAWLAYAGNPLDAGRADSTGLTGSGELADSIDSGARADLAELAERAELADSIDSVELAGRADSAELTESMQLSASAAPSIRDIAWDSLFLQETLGEGASGVIYRALWSDPADSAQPPQPVAVKLFKGHVTSDGSPLDELAACLAAGSHAHLIGAQGQISGAPEGRAGLLMALIAPSFENLAGPPSLASCTRDCYATERRFGLSVALRIANGIASAAAHLHARQLLHGDLYGHNILYNGEGGCLLGDFGAASFYPGSATGQLQSQDQAQVKSQSQGQGQGQGETWAQQAQQTHATAPTPTQAQAQAQALQRIEVRAFGILLGELLDRCDSRATTALEHWCSLQRRCTQAAVLARPSFAQITAALADIEVALD